MLVISEKLQNLSHISHNMNDTKQTLGTILGNKLLNFIAENSAKKIAKKILEFTLGLLIGVIIYRPESTIGILLKAFQYEDYAASKILAGVVIIYGRKLPWKIYKKLNLYRKKINGPGGERLIDGIPVNELADYLIRNRNFRREGANGVRETFGLHMEKFNRLANNLENKKILKRGENNMRVLDGRWSRQALIDFLGQSGNSGSENNWFRVFKLSDPKAKIRLDNADLKSV